MKFKLEIACAVVGLMALTTSLRALTSKPVSPAANASGVLDGSADSSNPYAVITDRNVFRLNPPPPPPSPVENKPLDVPKVYLDGIIKVGDVVQVLFSIPAKDGKGETSYFKLAPGEKDGVLELVRIFPNQQDVEVLVNGTPMTLSMLKDSLAAAGAKVASGGRAFTPPSAPLPVPTAAAPAESTGIIAGGSRDSGAYGSVAVGGGGVTTIGGGNNSGGGGGSSFGSESGSSGVSVGGGGGGGYGGNSYGSSGVSVAGGGNTGSQLANAISGLGSGSTTTSPGQAPVNNIPPEPTVSSEQQYQNMADADSDGKGPPLPPLVSPTGRRGQGGGGGVPMPP